MNKKDCSRVGKKFFTPWAPWALGFPSLPELFKSSSSLREVLMLCCNIHQCLSWDQVFSLWIWDPSFFRPGLESSLWTEWMPPISDVRGDLPLPHPALPLVQLKLYNSRILNEPVLNTLVTFHCSILQCFTYSAWCHKESWIHLSQSSFIGNHNLKNPTIK